MPSAPITSVAESGNDQASGDAVLAGDVEVEALIVRAQLIGEEIEASVLVSFPDAQQRPIGYSIDRCAKIVDAIRTNLNAAMSDALRLVIAAPTDSARPSHYEAP